MKKTKPIKVVAPHLRSKKEDEFAWSNVFIEGINYIHGFDYENRAWPDETSTDRIVRNMQAFVYSLNMAPGNCWQTKALLDRALSSGSMPLTL